MIEALALCVASVQDGNTFWTCAGTKVRLVAPSGPIDVPKIPSRRCKDCDRGPAIAAKQRLEMMLHGPRAVMHCDGVNSEKMRLCRVNINGREIGDAMIASGHATLRAETQP